MGKRKKKQLRIECIAYLSTDSDPNYAERDENRQERYIREYAKAHNIDIVGTLRRHALGISYVNCQFRHMAALVRHKKVDGVIAANMAAVSQGIEDAYRKVGMIKAAGGHFVTVDEGWLEMNIRED